MDRLKLYRLYWRAERLIAPGIKYSQEEYEEELFRRLKPDVTWLDLGCGRSLLPSWRAESVPEPERPIRTATPGL